MAPNALEITNFLQLFSPSINHRYNFPIPLNKTKRSTGVKSIWSPDLCGIVVTHMMRNITYFKEQGIILMLYSILRVWAKPNKHAKFFCEYFLMMLVIFKKSCIIQLIGTLLSYFVFMGILVGLTIEKIVTINLPRKAKIFKRLSGSLIFFS